MKTITKLLLFIILTLCVITIIPTKKVEAWASFTELSKTTQSLGYGVRVERITGYSKSSYNTLTQAENRFQSIWTATFDAGSDVQVVEWTNMKDSENYWGVTTLEAIAANYEKTHPGYKVLAATNNWLAGTQSNNVGELDGLQVVNGLNLRATDVQGNGAFDHDQIDRPYFVGFSKDGKNVIWSDDFDRETDINDYMTLYYYDEETGEKEDTGFKISKVNEEPEDGEVAIYFSNYDASDNVPGAKLYCFEGSILRHDNKANSADTERASFALGKFRTVTTTLDFSIDTENYEYVRPYYFVSKNRQFDGLDLERTLLCQYDFVGDLADVYSGTTNYFHIIQNGVGWKYDDPSVPWAMEHQINDEVHPRTVLVYKNDGTFAISVIDGRSSGGATGMDYEDMANFYLTYYDAKEAWNYDGGGSSCMIIANNTGGFDIVNNPSDGSERRVANATMFVVKEYDASVIVDSSTDTSITLNIKSSDTTISKINATLNGVTKEVINGQVTFDNLTPTTFYDVDLSYVIDDKTILGKAYRVYTEATKPVVENFDIASVDETSGTFLFNVNDLGKNYISGECYIDGEKQTFEGKSIEITYDNLSPGTNYTLEVYLKYHNTKNDSSAIYKYEFKTVDPKYPLEIELKSDTIDLDIGSSLKLEVNVLKGGTKTDYIWTSSDENIASVSERGKITAISEGEVTIKVETSEGVTASITLFITDPNAGKQSGCNSSTIIIILSTIACLLFILRKKH